VYKTKNDLENKLKVIFIEHYSTVQMSLRGDLCRSNLQIATQKEIATPPKTKSGGSQRHQFMKCTVEN
jgi:hypothetical protein